MSGFTRFSLENAIMSTPEGRYIYYTNESSGCRLFILISPLVWFLYHSDLKRKTPVKGLRCTRGHSFCFPTTTPNVVSSSALLALKALLTPLAICFAPILITAHSVLDYPRCLLSKSKMDLGSANTYMLFLQTQGEKRNKLLLHINTSYVRSP